MTWRDRRMAVKAWTDSEIISALSQDGERLGPRQQWFAWDDSRGSYFPSHDHDQGHNHSLLIVVDHTPHLPINFARDNWGNSHCSAIPSLVDRNMLYSCTGDRFSYWLYQQLVSALSNVTTFSVWLTNIGYGYSFVKGICRSESIRVLVWDNPISVIN